MYRLVSAFAGCLSDKSQNLMHLSIYRGSNMSVHVLLKLLNELGKSDKM